MADALQGTGPSDALSALAGIITAILAYLVYVEASRIRRIEWTNLTNTRWQSFNQMLIETKLADRWERLRTAEVAVGELDATDKRLLLMYFNNMLVEFDAGGLGLFSNRTRRAVRNGIESSVREFRPYSEYLLALFEVTGFHSEFARHARQIWARSSKPEHTHTTA